MNTPLLKVHEVAALLQVTSGAARNWLKRHKTAHRLKNDRASFAPQPGERY